MDQVNFQIMARFPFLHEASDYVKDLKLSIDILLKTLPIVQPGKEQKKGYQKHLISMRFKSMVLLQRRII